MSTGRHVTAALFAILGTGVVGVALVVMNARAHRPREIARDLEADIQVKEKKKKPPKTQTPKPKPRPRRARPNPAPRPSFGSQLSGLGGGIAVFSAGDLEGLGGDIMGGVEATKDMIHTANTVDSQPNFQGLPQPTAPGRAIKRGITGYVKIRALVNSSGRLEGINVVESEPDGVFDDAVVSTLSSWVAQPAVYGGSPVSMSVSLTFTFQ